MNMRDAGKNTQKRNRTTRSFPTLSFAEALFLAEAIQQHAAGHEVRKLTLFERLDRSPNSGPTRSLITSSNQYGITTGGYSADILDLTEKGRVVSSSDTPEDVRIQAKFDLALRDVKPFNDIYVKYKGNRLPSVEVLRDAAREAGVDDKHVAECIETFLANARDLGLIKPIDGSEHLVTLETVLDNVPAQGEGWPNGIDKVGEGATSGVSVRIPPVAHAAGDLSTVCFVISPIGSADSIERSHADLVLNSLIEPAIAELGLTAVRADKISEPGLITGQIIDHVSRAKLVIADLSFSNPNVYYELALRHATRKPIVQLIRASDKLPFDVGQYRTVHIDMTDIYTLVPQIDLHRQEITRQCRAALEEGATSESPLSVFYPKFWDEIQESK